MTTQTEALKGLGYCQRVSEFPTDSEIVSKKEERCVANKILNVLRQKISYAKVNDKWYLKKFKVYANSYEIRLIPLNQNGLI